MKALLVAAALLLTQGAGFTQVETNTICKSDTIRAISKLAQHDLNAAVQATMEGLHMGLCMHFPKQWVPGRPVGEVMTDATGEPFQVFVLTLEGEDTDGYTLAFPGLNTR